MISFYVVTSVRNLWEQCFKGSQVDHNNLLLVNLAEP